MPITLKKIPEFELLDIAKRQGSGDVLKDSLAPFTFFILLRWAEQQEVEEEAIALFDERPYTHLIPPSLRWSALTYLDSAELFHTVHKELLPTLEYLHDHPLAGILRAAAYAFDPKKITETLLYKAIRLVAELPFETAEDLLSVDKVIGRIIRRSVGSTRFAGEFITPAHIARLMLEIAAPKHGETIYDPCFGMGTLLAGAARRIARASHSLEPSRWMDLQGKSIYGVEIAALPFLVGLTRVILAGINNPGLAQGDTLERDPYSSLEQYDVVLAAPPIGGKVSDRWRSNHFPVPATSTENLFLQHIMLSLKKGGRAVVALPEGFLFRTGVDEKVREHLLNEFSVEGVISLPAGTLQPYTAIKANLLVFRRTDPANAIWFQEAKATGKADNNAVKFDAIAEAERFRMRQESESSWLASLEEITRRNFDLSVRRSYADELKDFIEDLRKHDASLEVVRLEEVADVISGIGYTRKDITKDPNLMSVPLIRVTELAKSGEIKTPPLYLTDDALERTVEKRLQQGDLLLSTHGTIGKVGRVREAYAGSIPAHGITTIRLKDGDIEHSGVMVSPLYLSRLLQSGPYQQWFTSHSFGTVIKNLSARELRTLPIPVPALQIQEAIATGVKANADSSEILRSIVSNRVYDEFRAFLLSNPVINELTKSGFDEADAVNQFSQLAGAFRPWRNKAAHDHLKTNKILSHWLLEALPLFEQIIDAFELPRGAERFALLTSAQTALEKVDEIAEGVGDLIQDRLWTIGSAIGDTLTAARESLLEEVKVSATLEPAIIDANTAVEVSVRFKNRGSLLLRDVRLKTSPDPSTHDTRLLPAGAEASWVINLPTSPVGNYPLTLYWSARRLDSKEVSGEVYLNYSARASIKPTGTVDFGENPYVVGNPLKPNLTHNVFFGRADIINQIRRSLRHDGPSTVLLLEGNRRTGKTSILYRLQSPGVLPGWITVYWTTQDADGSSLAAGLETKEIFYQIARNIVLAVVEAGFSVDAPGVGVLSPDMPRGELRKQLRTGMRLAFDAGNPFEQLETLVDTVSDIIGDQRVLLLLDEFDKIQEGIGNNVTSPQVPENLRALFHKYNKLSGIITGARRIKRLRESYWSALYGLGISLTVDELDIDAARKLITEPVEGRLVYSTNARERVVELTNRHPYFIQSLCYRIVEECADKREQSVTLSTVEAAAQEMLTNNEHFQELFDFIDNDRRRYLTCVVNRLSQGPDRVTFDLIAGELEKDEVIYAIRDLADDLKYLQELDVIDLEQDEYGTSYKIRIPLFSRWLAYKSHAPMHKRLAAEE